MDDEMSLQLSELQLLPTLKCFSIRWFYIYVGSNHFLGTIGRVPFLIVPQPHHWYKLAGLLLLSNYGALV
jgi:hypothetical protein